MDDVKLYAYRIPTSKSIGQIDDAPRNLSRICLVYLAHGQ